MLLLFVLKFINYSPLFQYQLNSNLSEQWNQQKIHEKQLNVYHQKVRKKMVKQNNSHRVSLKLFVVEGNWKIGFEKFMSNNTITLINLNLISFKSI